MTSGNADVFVPSVVGLKSHLRKSEMFSVTLRDIFVVVRFFFTDFVCKQLKRPDVKLLNPEQMNFMTKEY